jgi:hypothetical protein
MKLQRVDTLTTEDALTAVLMIFAQRGRAIREAKESHMANAPSTSNPPQTGPTSTIVQGANDQQSVPSTLT